MSHLELVLSWLEGALFVLKSLPVIIKEWSILNASKPDEIVKRAMPKTATVMTNAKMAKAKAMLANGYTYNEIAKACGVPESTVYSALNK